MVFLGDLYASTRAQELAQLTTWDETTKRQFLQMQFDAQHQYYLEQFPAAKYSIILLSGKSIGRLYVDRRDDEIRLIDIALMPDHRGSGLGTGILEALIKQAQQGGLPLRIHVEKNNPARRLYQRLGFVCTEDKGLYDLMTREPQSG